MDFPFNVARRERHTARERGRKEKGGWGELERERERGKDWGGEERERECHAVYSIVVT